MKSRVERAYEVVVEGGGVSPVVLCCEHASNALPAGMEWGRDAWIEPTHWAWDPGAALVTRDLTKAFQSRAVLSRVSRLVIDTNRPLYSQTLFRDVADGHPVFLNVGLPDRDRGQRVLDWWEPYHEALSASCAWAPAEVLLSVHSFTPVYEGNVRDVELGVLFESADDLAAEVMRALRPSGLVIRANEPWSGKGGMMFSCYKHARENGMQALELELRQDLLAIPEKRAHITQHVERALREVLGF
ncbi:MAG: N-formylglutamate amidohydrolase [Alphaproteobacteria bacterium]|nr:N-formylglutamate amidohydrolase [Alphaproteobacteria bacterium]